MNDSDADVIIIDNITHSKVVYVYSSNPKFNALYKNYTDYYEKLEDAMIFPYDVWQKIMV